MELALEKSYYGRYCLELRAFEEGLETRKFELSRSKFFPELHM